MAEYKEKMLILLVEKYRDSKKDSGTNVIRRRTSISPSQLYQKYSNNDGDIEQIEKINQAATECRAAGFLEYENNGFSSEIAKIYLMDEKVDEIEAYLESACHYESKRKKKKYVEEIITRYSGLSPVAEQECQKLQEVLDKNKTPKNYTQTEEILKALTFIERNNTLLYVREVSMLIYGSSKYFEENTLESVCLLLRSYENAPCKEGELLNEILGRYYIIPEKQKICLKGNITLLMAGKMLELETMKDGIEFFTEDMESLEQVVVHTPEFRTVENKTSYYRCQDQTASFFYLGGYATRYQRDFLKKVYQDNSKIQYWHFGDLDAGGFYIHDHLCRMTGIPFGLYGMSVAQLRDERFSGCLQPLSDHDRRRLKSLLSNELYREAVVYMLANNVKLEQEIISYYENKGNKGCLSF